MRILFDQGTPVPLRRALAGHTVSTAHEMGWAALDNGALLDAAEAAFDAFITTDRNLRHQQNLTGRRLATLVYLRPVGRRFGLMPHESRRPSTHSVPAISSSWNSRNGTVAEPRAATGRPPYSSPGHATPLGRTAREVQAGKAL